MNVSTLLKAASRCCNTDFMLSSVLFRAIFRETIFHFDSNSQASLLLANPSTRHARFQGLPAEEAFAPPFNSPLCCRSRRGKSVVTPTYVRRIRDEAIRYTHHGGGALVLFAAPGGGSPDAEAEEEAAGSPHFGGRARGILVARKAAVRLISHLAGGAESFVAFTSIHSMPMHGRNLRIEWEEIGDVIG